MADPTVNHIGAYVVAKEGLPPKANGAGTRQGAVIDRADSSLAYAQSCVLVAHVGAATGAPDSFTYDVKLQHGALADGSDMADFDGGAIPQVTAAGLVELDVDLAGAKRYIRVVETVALSGGSSPSLPAGVAVVFGGGRKLPL